MGINFGVYRINLKNFSGVVEVEITRSGSDLSQRSEVFCYSRASTAETGFDFEQVQQEVIFEPNEDRAICQVTLIDDYENQVVEGDEEFHVYLSGAVGATLGVKKETKIIISDVEEDSPKFEFAEAEVRAAESVGVVSVPVKRLGKYWSNCLIRFERISGDKSGLKPILTKSGSPNLHLWS